MKPPPFHYLRPAELAEAVAMLAGHPGDAKLLAGGQSLMPMLNFRLLAPESLIDLNALPGLRGIDVGPGRVRIGALTRHRDIETSGPLARALPILPAAMRHVAHLAIRNRGTLGGSLAHADPAAELPMLAVLLDGEVEVQGHTGKRKLRAADLFVAPLTTALADDEILTGIEVPIDRPVHGWAFEEFARRSGDFALSAVGVTLSLDRAAIGAARIAVAGAGETPLRTHRAEALLAGQPLTPDVRDAACEALRAALDPPDDLHGSADYRRHLAGVLAGRALDRAWQCAHAAGR